MQSFLGKINFVRFMHGFVKIVKTLQDVIKNNFHLSGKINKENHSKTLKKQLFKPPL